MSNRQNKIEQRKLEQKDYIIKSAEERAKERWESAQINAASAQSVLDYAIEQFEEHKEELTEEVIKETEVQIELRKKQIEEFIMSEKDAYLESLGIQAD